ncbi:hypothetical protein L4C39_20065 [Vibrio clamense]|uniref:hypothetical protein n=1 Tax=Vibrio clamense TaxID=2910254 RepID=UPI003D1DD08D
MVSILKIVFVVNFISISGIMLLLSFVDYFSNSRISDLLFYSGVLIWIVASLTWDGGKVSRNYDVDYVTSKMKSMVKGHDLQSEKWLNYRANYKFGLVMFIAGIPSFIGSFVLTYLV